MFSCLSLWVLHMVYMLIPCQMTGCKDFPSSCRLSSWCCFPCYAEGFQLATLSFPVIGVHKALESFQTVCVYSTLLLSTRRFSPPHLTLRCSCELCLCNVRDRDGDAPFFSYGYPVSPHCVLKSLSFLLHRFVVPC